MPKEVTESKWACVHCNKTYKTEREAVTCEESHDYIYLKITRLELKKLIEFLYTGNIKVLPSGLVERLAKLDRLNITC